MSFRTFAWNSGVVNANPPDLRRILSDEKRRLTGGTFPIMAGFRMAQGHCVKNDLSAIINTDYFEFDQIIGADQFTSTECHARCRAE